MGKNLKFSRENNGAPIATGRSFITESVTIAADDTWQDVNVPSTAAEATVFGTADIGESNSAVGFPNDEIPFGVTAMNKIWLKGTAGTVLKIRWTIL